MKVAIVGAGAVGLGLGATLYHGGVPLRVIARDPETRRSLRSHGLHRRGLFGDVHVPAGAIRIDEDLDALHEDPVTVLLVCTKTTTSAELARDLATAGLAKENGPRFVLCQNGWGNAEIFSRSLPRDRIFNARIITGFQREGPCEVHVTAHAQPISMGSLFGADPTPLDRLCGALSRGGIPCELSQDIGRDLWAKMLYNCALNPLGALLGVPYGELAGNPESRDILESVVREIFKVLRASNQGTHWTNADTYLDVFFRDLLPPTKEHRSSMLQDLRAGRATEIDALCGQVVEQGARFGIGTPVNAALRVLVKAREERAR